MDLIPQDVAQWRREMINWTRHEGADWYTLMIDLGQQTIRPAGPSDRAGQFLAQQEIKRLTEANLSFFDRDTCDIVSGAYGSMPPFAPVPTDLPSPSGFVMFAKPIMDRQPVEAAAARALFDRLESNAHPEHADLIAEFSNRMSTTGRAPDDIVEDLAKDLSHGDSEAADRFRIMIGNAINIRMRKMNEQIIQKTVKIVGASWSPAEVMEDQRFRAGAVWISFYSESNLDAITDDNDLLHRCRQIMPRLTVDNEIIVPWCPSDADRDGYVLDPTRTTAKWALMLLAAFRIGRQRSLCQETVERTPRAERRRTERDSLPPRDVTVVHLRRRSSSPGTGLGTKHSYRYPVSIHWRQQWYPSLNDHRPIVIMPHVRGPEGAELRVTDRVTVL
jgi:hypothetical protein